MRSTNPPLKAGLRHIINEATHVYNENMHYWVISNIETTQGSKTLEGRCILYLGRKRRRQVPWHESTIIWQLGLGKIAATTRDSQWTNKVLVLASIIGQDRSGPLTM